MKSAQKTQKVRLARSSDVGLVLGHWGALAGTIAVLGACVGVIPLVFTGVLAAVSEKRNYKRYLKAAAYVYEPLSSVFEKKAQIVDLTKEMSRQLGLENKITLLQMRGGIINQMPFSLMGSHGFSNPTVFIDDPSAVIAIPWDEKKALLAHELAHIGLGSTQTKTVFAWGASVAEITAVCVGGMLAWRVANMLLGWQPIAEYSLAEGLMSPISIAAYWATRALHKSWSRWEEYRADRGVLAQGADPLALACLLKRVDYVINPMPEKMEGALKEESGLYARFQEAAQQLTETHPRADKRIRRLKRDALKYGHTEEVIEKALEEALGDLKRRGISDSGLRAGVGLG